MFEITDPGKDAMHEIVAKQRGEKARVQVPLPGPMDEPATAAPHGFMSDGGGESVPDQLGECPPAPEHDMRAAGYRRSRLEDGQARPSPYNEAAKGIRMPGARLKAYGDGPVVESLRAGGHVAG